MRNRFFLILGAATMAMAAPLSAAVPRGDEPIAVPRTIKQGIDFVYVDPQMSTVARKKQRPQNWLQRIFNPARASRNRQDRQVPHGRSVIAGAERITSATRFAR